MRLTVDSLPRVLCCFVSICQQPAAVWSPSSPCSGALCGRATPHPPACRGPGRSTAAWSRGSRTEPASQPLTRCPTRFCGTRLEETETKQRSVIHKLSLILSKSPSGFSPMFLKGQLSERRPMSFWSYHAWKQNTHTNTSFILICIRVVIMCQLWTLTMC